ncbi:MAG TPA: PKD domain-containing protein [Capsulimonadaceae bacterium]
MKALVAVCLTLSISLSTTYAADSPPAQTVGTSGYRVFFLGNSFTVNTHYHSEYFAKCAGFTAHTHRCAWAPGMQLSGSWGHWARPESSAASDKGGSLAGWKRALTEYQWDKFVVQPFYDNQEACIDVCNKFYDYALANKSPNVQMIVKQIWFTRDVTSFETGRQPNGVAYFEAIADAIQKAHPGSTVPICPSGLVIQELRRLTALGQVPGVAHEADWYADPIHLSRIGNYADGMTQFITLYGVNPANFSIPADVSPGSWYGYTINEQTAKKIQEVAWRITSAYPRSGIVVGPSDNVAPKPPTRLSAAKVTSSSVVLNWSAPAGPEQSIASYSVYQDGAKGMFYHSNSAEVANLAPRTKYAFSVAAHNRVGISSPQSETLTITTPAPAIPVTAIALPAGQSALSLNIAVSKVIAPQLSPLSADNKGVFWSSSAPAIASVTPDGTVSGKAAGNATITATARDNTNGAISTTVAVTVLPNRAPIASFTTGPTKDKNPLAVAFDGAASTDPDPQDGIFGWDWDFGDGTPHFYGTSPTHVYASPGTYSASLIVLDNNSAFSEKLSKEVTVPAPAH